jgi:hypothetical protein
MSYFVKMAIKGLNVPSLDVQMNSLGLLKIRRAEFSSELSIESFCSKKLLMHY